MSLITIKLNYLTVTYLINCFPSVGRMLTGTKQRFVTNLNIIIKSLLSSIPSHQQRSRLFTFRDSRRSDQSAEECVQRTCKSNSNAKLALLFIQNQEQKLKSREHKSIECFEYLANNVVIGIEPKTMRH